MIVGAYSMHLYCDAAGCQARREGDAAFVGTSDSQCIRKARLAGWVVRPNLGTCRCPAHAGRPSAIGRRMQDADRERMRRKAAVIEPTNGR
jgi:hypothetical protein